MVQPHRPFRYCLLLLALARFSDAAWPVDYTVYIAPDDHTDYIWSAGEAAYEQAFLDMLDYYLQKADDTESSSPEFQSRWNCDGSFWLWTYEKNRTPAQFDRLMSRIADGHVNVPLNALSVCLGAAPVEAVIRGMYYPGQIERRYGVRFLTALAMENATMPYGVGSVWAGAGARYCWQGICNCDTLVTNAWDREHDVYWWVGPDGTRLLMKWNSQLNGNQSMGGYAEARNPQSIVDYVTTNAPFNGFEARYPYDVIGAFGQGWDDIQTTDQDLVTAAQVKTDSTRKVIVSNEVDYFLNFENAHGLGLPNVSQTFGNEWEIYLASMAEVASRAKRSLEKLRPAEAMATLVSLKTPTFMNGRETSRDQAWMDYGLFYEHNYGTAGASPALATEHKAWSHRLAGEIETYVDALYADARVALGGLIQKSGANPRLFAFNALSWTRTDFADYPYSGPTPVHVIDLSTGQETPSQIFIEGATTYLRILARNVPVVGYKIFEIQNGAGASFGDAATVAGSVLENATYSVTVAGRGAITSLIDKSRANREFIRNIGGNYANDLGSAAGTVVTENAGPVSVTLLATSASPVAHTSRITLIRESERIDIRNDINANFDISLHWRYGFEITSPDVWHEEVGSVIRAKLASSGGHYATRQARYDYLTLNHFADMSGGGVGVTLSNADCYFMKLGGSTSGSLDVTTPQINALAGGRVAHGGNGITNQGGDTHFLHRFALTTHGSFDSAQAMRFSLEHQNPLACGEVVGGTAYPEQQHSFLSLSDPNVILWALKPAEDAVPGSVIARTWNQSNSSVNLVIATSEGNISEASRVSHIETYIEPATVSSGQLNVTLAGKQLQTFSIEIGGSSPLPTETTTQSPTPSDTGAATHTPTSTPSPTTTDTVTRTPVSTSTPSFTATVTSTPVSTSTPSPSSTATSTPAPTSTSSSTPTPSSTPAPADTPSPTATEAPSGISDWILY